MKMKFTVLVYLLLITSICFSQTTILPGNVSGNWPFSGSPYLITGNISIASGSTLTIDPGVIVNFQGHYQLTVYGRILALGTQNDTISFTAQDTLVGWHGIKLLNLNTNGMDSSKFIYCRFSSGRASGSTTAEKRGGAIYAEASSQILFRNCLFTNNYAEYDGGAVCLLSNSNPDIENCTFNYSTCDFYGGGIYVDASNPKIKNSLFTNGNANIFGAGVVGWNGSMFRLENCRIINNTAGAACGIYTAVNSAPVIVNCLFSGNQTVFGNGGAMGFSVSNPTLINCTIVNNTAAQTGAGAWFYQSTGVIENCIVWDNIPDDLSFDQSTVTVEYSDLSSGISGTGNISVNPVFVGAGNDPYSIQETSPCRNTGTPDTTGLWLPAFDLAGNQRISEDTIDMGAYEYYVPVPVELISFTSYIHENSVVLNWTTATELNNSGFEVQRKVAGSNDWLILDFIEGQGTTTETSLYSYSDFEITPGKYNYRFKQIDFNGNYTFHNLSEEVIIGIPDKFELSQNYPNPFNPTTTIKYSIPSGFSLSNVSLKVYDILGKEVATLINKKQEAGNYEVEFNASKLSSGVYLYRLQVMPTGQAGGRQAGDFVQTRKMIILK